MQRLLFQLSVLITLAANLVACSPKAADQPVQLNELEYPTLTALLEPSVIAKVTEAEVVPHDPPPSCPITVRQDPPFIPPVPYDTLGFEEEFWYGSNSLWTAVRENGIWEALPLNPAGYTQKVFWWRDGYVGNKEQQPDLTNISAEATIRSAPRRRSLARTDGW